MDAKKEVIVMDKKECRWGNKENKEITSETDGKN